MTITIADGRGALWQWDTGRRVKITDGAGVKQIHYQNRALGGSVDVDVGTDGTAVIPDELLQDWHPLTAYAYVTDDTGGYTKAQVDFAVHKRARPSDYVYTPTEHAGFDRLRTEIGDLSALQTAAKDNLVAAINEAARTGGGGESDHSKLINRDAQDQHPIGAIAGLADALAGKQPKGDYLTADKLQSATDAALAQAKASGVFDGAQGEKGAPGKTPVKGTDYWTAADKQEIIDDIHPAFYIDLAGNHLNYTCQVAMDDIKAAYNSGYNLVCRCTLDAYTATLPLFVPMPAANVWIFSGSGALAAMSFPAQSLTIAIVNGVVQASNTRLASMDNIPDIPDALPNPEVLNFTGAASGFYDGKEAKTVNIPTVPTALKNPNALTIKIGSTTVTYDGSAAQTVTIADGTEVEY